MPLKLINPNSCDSGDHSSNLDICDAIIFTTGLEGFTLINYFYDY